MKAQLVFEADERFLTANDIVVDGLDVSILADALRGSFIWTYGGSYVEAARSQLLVSSDLKKLTLRSRIAAGAAGLRTDSWRAGAVGGIFHSDDDGKTWKLERIAAIPEKEQVLSIVDHEGATWLAGVRGTIVRDKTLVERPGAVDRGVISYGASHPYPELELARLKVVGGELYALGKGLWRLDAKGAALELESPTLLVDLTITEEGTLLVAGTSGVVWRKPTRGAWTPVSPSNEATYVGVVALPDGVLLVSSLGDDALRFSTDDGKTFAPMAMNDGQPISKLLANRRFHMAVADGHGGALVAGWQGMLVRVANDGLGPWATAKPKKKVVAAKAPKAGKAPPIREKDPAREAELLGAILAAPADDQPRLVYADWLLEHDDPRGEFIQLQVALGTPRSASGEPRHRHVPPLPSVEHVVENRLEMEKREIALMKKHQTAWGAPIKPFVYQVLWRRGFIDYVEAKGGVFLDGAAQVFAATPLVHAILTSFDAKSLPKLLTAEPLRRLPSLSLAEQRIGPKQAGALSSAHFSGLRFLDLARNPLRDDGVTVLAENPHLVNLQSLRLYGCGVGRAGLEALSKAPWFSTLQSLDLSIFHDEPHEKIGPAAAKLVAQGSAFKHLGFMGLELGDEGAEELAASALPHLEGLSLDGVTAAGLLTLARSKTLVKLQHLAWNLQGGKEGPHAAALRKAIPELRARFGSKFADGWDD